MGMRRRYGEEKVSKSRGGGGEKGGLEEQRAKR